MRIFKTFFSLLTALMLAVGMAVNVCAQGAGTVNGVSVSASQVRVGDTFTVTVYVPPAEDADTISLRVGFNADAFEVVSWAPLVSGGVAGSGEGFFALAAANASRLIDLSDGLALTAQLKVKESAQEGDYTLSLLQSSVAYVKDNGYEFEELWQPSAVSAVLSVAAAEPQTQGSVTENLSVYDEPTEQEDNAPAETAAAPAGTEAPADDDEIGVYTDNDAAPSEQLSLSIQGDTPAAVPVVYLPDKTEAPESAALVKHKPNPGTGVGAAVILPLAAGGCILLGKKSRTKRKRTRRNV